jgi:PEGA domain
VSRRFSLFWVTVSLVALFLAGSASAASAQGHRGRAVVRTAPAVARSHYYRPYYRSYYRPYYYRPYFYGGPYLYSSFFWYPYPYYYAPYGLYGGYYGGYYDPLSSVRIEVRPREAHVYVDGYFAGEVDKYDGTFQRLRLRPGPHQIEVYLEGYKTLRQTVYLTPDSTFKLRGDLAKLGEGQPPEPAPTPKAVPNRSGRNYGPPPSAGRRAAPPMPDSSSEPVVQGPEEPGQPEAGARDSQFGTVSIRFQPADAEVLIDGEAWQGADSDQRLLVNLEAGPHRIEVRKADHKPFSTDVDVRPGETTTVNVSLPKDGRP